MASRRPAIPSAPVLPKAGRSAITAILLGSTLSGQEVPDPKPVEPATFLPRTSYQPTFYSEEDRNYNLRWGKLTGRLRGSVQAEYSDNINLSDTDELSDVVIGPFIGIGFLFPLSELNVLQFDLGLGYRLYLDHSELNTLIISPDSRLNYQIRLGNINIAIHDKFSLEVDPLSDPELSGDVLDYRRFKNEAGLTVNWEPMRKLSLVGGYSYGIDRSLNDDFKDLDRDDHFFHLGGYQGIGERINLGLRSTYTIRQYVLPVQNDGTIFSIGPHLITQLTDFITADGGVSYTTADYEQSGSITDSSDFEGLTFFAGAQHRINSRTSHYLRAERTVNPGYGSNFTDIFALQYGISVRASSSLTLKGTFVFEDLMSSGTITENSNRYLGYLAGDLRVSQHWVVGLAYSFGLKDSDFPGHDYTLNRVTLDITRHF